MSDEHKFTCYESNNTDCNTIRVLQDEVVSLRKKLNDKGIELVNMGADLLDMQKIARHIEEETWSEAIEEVGRTRPIFLTESDVIGGALSEDWPVLKIRKQMRNEIVQAMEARSPGSNIIQELRDKLEHARRLIGRLMWEDGLCVECTQENHDKPCQLSEELEKLEATRES